VNPTPPTVAESIAPLRLGSTGWPVFALQVGINDDAARRVLEPDGDFGPGTNAGTKAFQLAHGLTADGIAGPATRSALTTAVCARIDAARPACPHGLMRNMARGEGGDNPGAVNWQVVGGVDCGLYQLRVFGPPFVEGLLRAAFRPVDSGLTAADAFLSRRTSLAGKAWTGGSRERAGRCALMAHNWPTAGGADYIAEHGRCSNPDGKCTWLPRDVAGVSLVHFTDGSRVETRWDWCQFYAMGGAHGEASLARGVVW
jgi:hypothetical protein